MKLPQTRIKVETRGDGKLVYCGQYKGWLFWHHLEYCISYYDGRSWYKQQRDTLTAAQRDIDEFLKEYEEKQKRKSSKKIVNTVYIKYP